MYEVYRKGESAKPIATYKTKRGLVNGIERLAKQDQWRSVEVCRVSMVHWTMNTWTRVNLRYARHDFNLWLSRQV